MSEGGWYQTSYPQHTHMPSPVSGAGYGSYLYAESLPEAYRLVAERGAGEMIISGPMRHPLTHPDIPKMIRGKVAWKTVLHASCFTCWHAMRAGVITPDEALGDSGLVHSIVHIMNGASDERGADRRERLAELADLIERRIPGWRKPDDE